MPRQPKTTKPQIERDEWIRIHTYSEDRALKFLGLTRETADVKALERAPFGQTVYGVRPKKQPTA